MRIVLVTTSLAPDTSGLGRHVFEVAHGLAYAGHHVVIWVAARSVEEQKAPDGVPVRYLPSPLPERGLRSVAAFLGEALRASKTWLRAFMADRPEVVHVHGFAENGVWASAWAPFVPGRLVVTSHGETLGDLRDVFDGSKIFRASLRGALGRASAVTAPSHYVLNDLVNRFELASGAGHVVPNGSDAVDTSAKAPPWAPECFVLGVGRLEETKGFDLLVAAFARARLPVNVQLIVVGEGAERTALEELVNGSGLVDRVHFCGALRRSEVDSLMRASIALVIPSRSDAFPLVLLEGWRAGTAIIVSVHGGGREIVEHGADALLVDPLDVDALATTLRCAVLDDDLREILAAGGVRSVERFSWSAVVQQYESIYRNY
ncbi:glycosyltransferase family 4 protein [Cellulosimicrobium marinum]|uniref:glycosyltransferase family 4 protein n=1 Tax=Cellulosimicrobium marinum TaxID=1638992 RepID=UPI001E6028A1|nr:glycosyltransferase family 4 protein [Cellulosimicrobium marinum]MCB7137067.1 glycosyltransferase family 4 protein [Cellulosimicrobium marinum]